MMELHVSCKKLCGRSNSAPCHRLHRLATHLSRNHTGYIDYNKYGVKDGRGFISCGDKFVESFHLYERVASEQVQKRCYLQLGTSTKRLQNLLSPLKLARVKAVHLKKQPSGYEQEYKVSCAEEEYDVVMSFLRSQVFNQHEVFLKDIDVAGDFGGSFNKNDLIKYLLRQKGYRLQHSSSSEALSEPTILQNESHVGRNCLTYIERDGVRCRLYNKMVMILEKKGLYHPVGQQWMKWARETNTRCAKARDVTSQRGLTHAKVTFTFLPSDAEIESSLNEITKIPNELVYSTAHAGTWKAYCDSLQHSMVLIDRQNDLGLVVYSCNEVTNTISGHLVKRWTGKEQWCLANLLLAGSLPVDIFEVSRLCHVFDDKHKDTVLCVQGQKYDRQREDGSVDFPTRLTTPGSVFTNYHEGTQAQANNLVEMAGLVTQPSCEPQLVRRQASKNTKVDLLLIPTGIIQLIEGEPLAKRAKINISP